jgi:transposase
VTVLQFVEDRSDRQAAGAARARIDRKYALGRGLTDPGFDPSVPSEFRTRLLAGAAEQRLPDALRGCCRDRGRLKARGRQRTDSTRVLARVRAVNRLECGGGTLRYALHTPATVAPERPRAHSPAEWLGRYSRRFDDARLPTGPEQRQARARRVGADGHAL